MFFPQFMRSMFGPKKKNFTYQQMSHAWIRGQMSVLEFVQAGGKLSDLQKTWERQFQIERNVIASGSMEEMKEAIDKKLIERGIRNGK